MKFASKDTRERAVAAYKSGQYSQSDVARMFGVHYKTIQNWMKADAEGREQVPRPKGHLKPILTHADLKKIDEIMTENPSMTLNQLMERIGKICTPEVYGRALKKLGYTYKKNSQGRRAGSGRYKKTERGMAKVEQNSC